VTAGAFSIFPFSYPAPPAGGVVGISPIHVNVETLVDRVSSYIINDNIIRCTSKSITIPEMNISVSDFYISDILPEDDNIIRIIKRKE
jgi:hypothetical protein